MPLLPPVEVEEEVDEDEEDEEAEVVDSLTPLPLSLVCL
jgi:hypothetical protein